MRYLLYIVPAILCAFFVATMTLAQGTGTINQLDQWRRTATGQITQNIPNSILRLTGYESPGFCLVTDSFGNVSTSTCGTGGGTPGGSNGQLQFNNGGSFGGTSTPSVVAINSVSSTATSTLPNIIAQTIRSFTSAGLTFLSNSGSLIADFGAGGGSNASFFGGVNIDGQTRLATSLTGLLTAASGVVTSTTTSAGLTAILSDETGTGSAVFSANPTFTGMAVFDGLTGATATFTSATATTLATNRLNLGADGVTDLTGTGLTLSGGALTLDVTGDWTGTFDGQEGTWYRDRANHTGTQLSSTISDLAATIQSLSVGTTSAGTVGNLAFWTGARTLGNVATSSLGLRFTGLADTQSSLTANRVIFTNSAGTALTDSANFVFGGTNLGLGTSTPGSLLTLAASNPQLLFSDTDNSLIATISANNANLTYNTATANRDHIFQAAGATLMTVAGTGRVGIGTSTPAAQLEVVNPSGGTLRLSRNDAAVTQDEILGQIDFSTNDTDDTAVTASIRAIKEDGVFSTVPTALVFFTDPHGSTLAERMRLTAAGNLGLGTTSPSALLTVAGDMRLTGRFADSASSTGTLGNVLTATATGTRWVATSTLGFGTIGAAIAAGQIPVYNTTGTTLTATSSLIINQLGSPTLQAFRSTSPFATLGSAGFGSGASENSVTEVAVISGAGTNTPAFASSDQILTVFDTVREQNAGGGIAFSVFGQGVGTIPNTLGIIRGGKTNATAGDYSGFLSFFTSFDATGSQAGGSLMPERMRITHDGNVGIGTTSPSQRLEVNGGIRLNTTTAKPACNATSTRGTTWFTQSDAGVKDVYEVCAKDASDVYAWRLIY